MCVGRAANQTEVLEQVVAERHLKEKRGERDIFYINYISVI